VLLVAAGVLTYRRVSKPEVPAKLADVIAMLRFGAEETAKIDQIPVSPVMAIIAAITITSLFFLFNSF
jgi:hypothetical protein